MHMCVHAQESQKSGSSVVPQKTYTVFLETGSFTGSWGLLSARLGGL